MQRLGLPQISSPTHDFMAGAMSRPFKSQIARPRWDGAHRSSIGTRSTGGSETVAGWGISDLGCCAYRCMAAV
jgi:hypothetical protein